MSVSVSADTLALGAFTPNREHLREAERQTKKLRKDPHRRRRYLSHVRSDHSVIRSALATLEALLEHSGDDAGKVFPSQVRLARMAGLSERTVQRHLQELRDAGYLLVYVYAPKRDAETGRWRRRLTNRYYFVFTKAPGNGHRVMRNRRSHLHDTDDVSNPLGMSNHRPSGAGGGSVGLMIEGVRRPKGAHPPSGASSGRWSDEMGCSVCDQTGWMLDSEGSATRCSCAVVQ